MTELELRDALIDSARKFILCVEAWYFPNSVPDRETQLNISITELKNHLDVYWDEQDREDKKGYNDPNEKNRT